MSSSPHHSPPPHRITPSQLLELTPSPPSSPKSQPVVVRHETPPTNKAYKFFPSEEYLKLGDTSSVPPPLERLGIDSLSSSSEYGSLGDREDGGREEEKDEGPTGNPAEGGERERENHPKSPGETSVLPSQQVYHTLDCKRLGNCCVCV